MDTPSPSFLHGVHRVVCLGASITQMGDPGDGYVAVIRRGLQHLAPDHSIEVLNAGISGNKAPDMLARWQSDVLDKSQDLVTVHVGLNDVWHGFDEHHPNGGGPAGTPLPRFLECVGEMITSTETHSIKLLLISPSIILEDPASPQNQRVKEYIRAERGLADRSGVRFVDVHRPLTEKLFELRTGPADPSLYLTEDGVHPLPSGAKIMAYHVLRALDVPVNVLENLL